MKIKRRTVECTRKSRLNACLKEIDAHVPGNEKKTTVVESRVRRNICTTSKLPEMVEPEDLDVHTYCTKVRCDTGTRLLETDHLKNSALIST